MTHPKIISVCAFESRRASEIAMLIEKHGARATVAPSMKEVPLDQNATAFAFAETLFSGGVDIVVFLTGVGTRALLELLESRHPRDAVREAFGKCQVVVRGPKPVGVLRDWNIRIDHRAPEPNTWRELLATLEKSCTLNGSRVAVQEYGVPNAELTAALAARGASVLSVPVYRWALPDDLSPLEQAIQKTVEAEFDLLLFTSAQQVRHVLSVADRLGLANAWRAAAERCLVGSIGPTCTEALQEEGLRVDMEASPPKMGQLVRDAVQMVRQRTA